MGIQPEHRVRRCEAQTSLDRGHLTKKGFSSSVKNWLSLLALILAGKTSMRSRKVLRSTLLSQGVRDYDAPLGAALTAFSKR